MINSYLNITVIAEWITFLASILILDKRTTVWRLFILLFFLIHCTEIIGWYLSFRLHRENGLPFNILMLFSNTFLMWFFSRSALLKPIEKAIIFFAGFFLAFALVNLFFFQGANTYNSFSEVLADIILAIMCCYFLYALVKNAEDVDLLRFDYFWLSIGVLFYTLGCAVLYPFANLLEVYHQRTNINVGEYINYTLSLILYGCLIIAFLCRRKVTR